MEDGRGVKLLLIDNEDCFIHTLANYVRQTGAEVVTYRTGFPLEMIAELNPGGLLPMDRMLRTLRVLTHEVIPALR